MVYPILHSVSRRLVCVWLAAILGIFGLYFAFDGCNAEKQESHELFKPQMKKTKIPSYYLTEKEIGTGYKLRVFRKDILQFHSAADFEMAECVELELPPYINGYGHVFYPNPDRHREVTLLVEKLHKSGLEYFGDTITKMSYKYDKECRPGDRWRYKTGATSWLVVHSNRVEGLSHNGFGLRMTEWWPLYTGEIPYPPTEKQLETDKHILADSSARAYGLVGDYLVTVFIDAKTQEPPSEQELKRLWNLQVEKLLKHIEKEK